MCNFGYHLLFFPMAKDNLSSTVLVTCATALEISVAVPCYCTLHKDFFVVVLIVLIFYV